MHDRFASLESRLHLPSTSKNNPCISSTRTPWFSMKIVTHANFAIQEIHMPVQIMQSRHQVLKTIWWQAEHTFEKCLSQGVWFMLLTYMMLWSSGIGQKSEHWLWGKARKRKQFLFYGSENPSIALNLFGTTGPRANSGGIFSKMYLLRLLCSQWQKSVHVLF